MDNDQRQEVIAAYKSASPGQFVLVHEPFRIEVIGSKLNGNTWSAQIVAEYGAIKIWQPRDGGWDRVMWHRHTIQNDPRVEPWMATHSVFYRERK